MRQISLLSFIAPSVGVFEMIFYSTYYCKTNELDGRIRDWIKFLFYALSLFGVYERKLKKFKGENPQSSPDENETV